METRQQQYRPEQIHTSRLKRGSVIVAVDGPLTVQYRDESLSWLLAPVPLISSRLAEGERHVLLYDAFVAIHSDGLSVVTGLIIFPQSWTSRFVHLLHTGWLTQWSALAGVRLGADASRDPQHRATLGGIAESRRTKG